MNINLVCDKQTCLCTLGSKAANLTASNQKAVATNGKAMASVKDCDFQAGAFGNCTALTARNNGSPTPCQPDLAKEWMATTLTPKADGCRLLSSDAKLSCRTGGIISIPTPDADSLAWG